MKLRSFMAASALALFAVMVPRAAYLCEQHQGKQAAIKTLTVDELATAIQNKESVALFDANGSETRAKYGVIPGAKLLSHYAKFEAAKELPANKADHLVFYCGGPKCNAAPEAAYKAVDAGYTHVSVLSAGIKGWVEAGKPVSKPVS